MLPKGGLEIVLDEILACARVVKPAPVSAENGRRGLEQTEHMDNAIASALESATPLPPLSIKAYEGAALAAAAVKVLLRPA